MFENIEKNQKAERLKMENFMGLQILERFKEKRKYIEVIQDRGTF